MAVRVVELLRSVLAFGPIAVPDQPLLLRALEVHQVDRSDFAQAYLVARAERSGVGAGWVARSASENATVPASTLQGATSARRGEIAVTDGAIDHCSVNDRAAGVDADGAQ